MNIENKLAYLLPEERELFRVSSVSLMKSVYAWMCLGLCATALMAMIVANSYSLLNLIFSSNIVFWGLCFAEIALVWFLSSRIDKMSFISATALFFVYSLLNGVTISSIFVVYTMTSVANVFFITAGTFGITSLVGFFTKKDMSSWGNILFMGLVGIIVASLVNLFIASDTASWIISIVTVALFVGLTAYDTQKIKSCLINANGGVETDTRKVALLGALSLYLDFINLFLALLRLVGRRN